MAQNCLTKFFLSPHLSDLTKIVDDHFHKNPETLWRHFWSSSSSVIVESWPIVTFGILKLETNESVDAIDQVSN